MISLIFLLTALTICAIAMAILFGSRVCTPLQYLYAAIFERRTFGYYRAAVELIKSGTKIPIITLEDFCEKQVHNRDWVEQFMSENQYFLMLFTEKAGSTGRRWELVLYDNRERIVVSSFFEKLTFRLAALQGYKKEDLNKIMQDNANKHSELLKEMKRQIEDLKE